MKHRTKIEYSFTGSGKGQSLTEYGLIVTLVSVISIGGLITLGDSLVKGLLSTQGQPSSAATSLSTSDVPPGSMPAPSPATGGSGTTTGQGLSISLSSGAVISVPNYVTDIKETIVTAGVNGTTSQLSNTLVSLADQLQNAGNLTPAEADMLKQLANKGHKIGGAEKLLETNLSLGLLDKPVTYDGKQYYTSKDLAVAIGSYTDGTGPILSDFQDTLQQINNSGMLKDPAISQFVNGLSKDIINIADMAEDTLWTVTSGTLPKEEYAAKVASTITHSNSSDICQTGGNTDSGVQCN